MYLPPPKSWATTTFPPKDKPSRRDKKSPTTGMSLPTAAMACLPTNCPNTVKSAPLYNCCNKAVATKGNVKAKTLSHNEPCNISIGPPNFIYLSPPSLNNRRTAKHNVYAVLFGQYLLPLTRMIGVIIKFVTLYLGVICKII